MRHINRYPQKGMRLTLMLLPFVVLIAAWFMGSAVRLEANPQDKLLPGLSQMVAAIDRMAFTPDKRSGEYLLWADTLISLSRLLTGLAVSSLIGLGIGIAAGVFPMYRAALSPLLTVVSMIPPLAILPVLFIVFGLDELSKVMLIVIGITPMLARDLEQRAQKGRFTTAGRADHRAKLALFHLQIDALQHHVVAVLLPDVFDVDKTHPRPPSAHGKQALCSWRSARSISHASKVIQMT